MSVFQIGELVQVLATWLQTQLPANTPRQVADNGPSAWAFVSHMGDHDGAPGPSHSPGPVLAVVDI